MKYLLGISLAINISLAFLFVNESNVEERNIIASSGEVDCISALSGKIYNTKKIIGPFYFEEYYVIDVGEGLDGSSFEREFSGCFYNAHTVITSEARLEETIDLLRQNSNDGFGLFKRVDKNEIHILAK
ncbi:hypothetical protein [Alteromonas halophila]|uniref:Uncharacterized protein n=1 Tax=Alteromonas halophila TaxID=516698 RepID=A0A918JMF8_9ALTE|nr:hypothetical protein [Alteromonas halophila]GGW87277.1 hypothetical protein GCM10007391_21450 [Alteromonas halophila]